MLFFSQKQIWNSWPNFQQTMLTNDLRFLGCRVLCARQRISCLLFPNSQEILLHTCKLNATPTTKESNVVSSSGGSRPSSLTIGEKVKQNTKDASYLGVILIGVGITGALFFTTLRELFSGFSPNGVYSRALDKVSENADIQNTFGTPIKGYGETNSRGRRRHVSHAVFDREGVPHMRMKFYVEGPRGKGTVHLEIRQDGEQPEYRYLFVEVQGQISRRTVILEDNRFQGEVELPKLF